MRSSSLGWFILAIGALAGATALFGPSRPLANVDLGATGATLFVFALAGAIWLFAARGADVFPEHTSIAERRAWVGLIFLLLLIAVFVREFAMLAARGHVPDGIDEFFGRRFIERYATLGIAWAVLSHLLARGEAGVSVDERDLRLRHRADRAGDIALTVTVIAGIVPLATVSSQALTWWLSPVVLANLLIGLLMSKQLVEHIALVISYRLQDKA